MKNTIFTADNYNTLNEFSDSLMNSIQWQTVYNRLRMVSASMDLLEAREYSVELDLHKGSLSFNGEEVLFEFYSISTETGTEIYLFFPEVEQYHTTVKGVDEVYEALRDLVRSTTEVLDTSL